MQRKILVTGSNGTLGSYIASSFPNDSPFLMTKDTLDITQKKAVSQVFEKIRPDVVIHLAAKTNVDACEKDEENAYKVNALGTEFIAKASREHNAFLIYVSTSSVFNGEKKYYTEDDTPCPINIYGKTKLLGEKAIEKENGTYCIIRIGWLIGGGKKEKKFLSYLVQQADEGKKEIQVVNDKFGTIAYARELADFMAFLLETKKHGVYHFGSLGRCSRFTLAEYVMQTLKKDVILQPVSSEAFVDRFFAPRPTNEVLRSVKLPATQFRQWKDSLKDYLQKELQHE